MKLVKAMSSAGGRTLRALAGAVLIVLGVVQGGAWVVLAVVGLVPLLAGALNVCLVAPLFGQTLKSR